MFSKKNIFFLSIGLCIVQLLHAQTDERKEVIEFGLQANQVLKQITSFGTNSIPFNNPYLITSKFNLYKNGKVAFRGGFGMNIDVGNSNTGSANNKSNLSSFDFRFGLERKGMLYKQFYLFYGLDMLWGIGNNRVVSRSNIGGIINLTQTNTTSLKIGGGPMLGLEYRLNPSIKFGVESTYYATIYNEKISSNGIANVALSFGLKFIMSPPITIYMSFTLFNKKNVSKEVK